MGFAMDTACSLGIGCRNEATDVLLNLVHPIFVILNAIFLLNRYILLVSPKKRLNRQAWDAAMDIHVKGHALSRLV